MEIFLRELCRFQHSERRKAAGPPAALRPLRANFFAQFLSKPRARGEIRCTGIPQAWHLLKTLCINANPSSQKADAELSTLATEILQYLSRNPSVSRLSQPSRCSSLSQPRRSLVPLRSLPR